MLNKSKSSVVVVVLAVAMPFAAHAAENQGEQTKRKRNSSHESVFEFKQVILN